MFDVPILLLIYNRVPTLARVVDVLRVVQPKTLIVAADGPKKNVMNDAARCREARAVIDNIDWPCRIIKEYASENKGSGLRVSSAITKAFQTFDQVIILEDDCLPDPSFFPYCETLLKTYANNPEVMMISGTNLMGAWKNNEQSFHFSRFSMPWGWATWRNRWARYDYQMSLWSDETFRQKLRAKIDTDAYHFSQSIYDRLRKIKISTWDYQWSMTLLIHQGLAAVPAVNLVRNIGFGEHATHTTMKLNICGYMDFHSVSLPLVPPPAINADAEYDQHYLQWYNGSPPHALVLRHAEDAVSRGDWMQAMIWIDAMMAKSTLPAVARNQFQALRKRALDSRKRKNLRALN